MRNELDKFGDKNKCGHFALKWGISKKIAKLASIAVCHNLIFARTFFTSISFWCISGKYYFFIRCRNLAVAVGFEDRQRGMQRFWHGFFRCGWLRGLF